MPASLPIEPALPGLIAALRAQRRAVLEAPPGAGKTTRVPLALLEAGLTTGRIVMLEPRRLAARAAAERLAEQLGEPVGRTVGFRMRGETKCSNATRIEVVTEGILTRMLQSDPELGGWRRCSSCRFLRRRQRRPPCVGLNCHDVQARDLSSPSKWAGLPPLLPGYS